MKSNAAILVSQNQPLEFWELEIPLLKEGQVLVEVLFSGLCHSQLNEWKGAKGLDPYLPHTMGHEGSGRVLDIGPRVTKVKPGDHVVLSWIKGTGFDSPSTVYFSGNRKVNSGAISTFLSKAVISENRLIPIAKEVPLREAALLGCAIPTGAGVIFNNMKIKEGQSIVIFGSGGIGLSALLAAVHLKANPIVAIDVQDEKLKKAKQFGATHTINANNGNVKDELEKIFQGKGADFCLESAGKKEAMEIAFETIRPGGGQCVLAGNLPKGEKIHIDPFQLILGKKIIGTWGGGSKIDHDIPNYIEKFIKNENILKKLVTHEVQLSNINSLMVQLDQGLIGRGMISFN